MTLEISGHQRRAKIYGRFFVCAALAILVVSLSSLLYLFYNLAENGLERLSWDFITSFPSRFPHKAGIFSAWVGSIWVVAFCMLFTIPIGIGAAIYLEEYMKKRWYSAWIEICVGNLAGVPSIIYGLLALGLFVYQFGLGQSVLTAGLTLSLLVLPIVIVSAREALRSVPDNLKEAAYALGASKLQMLRHHQIPYAQSGIFTGVILSLSRALGETAPLITIGALSFIAFVPEGPMDAFTVLPIQIFNWTSRPQAEFHQNAAAASLILVSLTVLLNLVAILLRNRSRRKYQW